MREATSPDTHDIWEEGVPSVPWVGVGDCFHQEDQILVVPEEVAARVEEDLSGGVGDRTYSVVAEDGRVALAG